MTVKISKPAINIRAELADLKKPSGIAGEAVLRAETPQEQFNLIGAGRKNLVINGAMDIDQRNSGSAVTPTTDQTYTLDRFSARLSAASKYSVQQVADSPSGYSNSLKVTSAAATTPGTNDYYQINTPIEGYNTNQLAQGSSDVKQFTLSFWVKSSLTGTFGGAYSNNAGNKFYAWTYTIDLANTWEHKLITITGSPDGSWENTTLSGLWVYWTLGAGSGQQASPGSWSTTFKRGPTGATNVVATSGATWQITGVQLEVGSVCTPFEHRLYGEEFALCQRYYQRFDADGQDYTNIGTAFGTTAGSSTKWYVPIILPGGRMRTDPSLSFSAVSDFRVTLQHTSSDTCSAIVIGYNNPLHPNLQVTAGSNVAGVIRMFGYTGNASAYLAFDAEL